MDISIKEVLKDFLIYISKERNFSNHTVSAYDRDLKKFIRKKNIKIFVDLYIYNDIFERTLIEHLWIKLNH